MTAGRNGFNRMYQTPSFLSPDTKTDTEKIPSMTTFSNTSTIKNQNNGTSMLDKHTIIFESDTEYNEDELVRGNTPYSRKSHASKPTVIPNSM